MLDILRNIRSARNIMSTRPDYYHVLGHMDNWLKEHQLSLEHKLNRRCDLLAKMAVLLWIYKTTLGVPQRNLQLLPNENAAILVKGVKINGEISDTIRYAVGKENARNFLTSQQKWKYQQFDQVDWENLHRTIKHKADGYKTWLSKQVSGFCGTRGMVCHYSKGTEPDKSCPNCGIKETSSHLCACMNPDRTRLLEENVKDLEAWLFSNHNTEPQLARMIPSYILGQGKVKFQKLGSMSPQVLKLAKSQDVIGWKNFMEGRISKYFGKVQEEFLKSSDSLLNGQDWVKLLISKILRMTHSQWIYRNITLHDSQGGVMRTREMEKMREEAIAFSQTDPLNLKPESHFLLELDEDKYVTGENDYVDKCYFIAAARAALCAGKRKIDKGKTSISRLKKRLKIPLKGSREYRSSSSHQENSSTSISSLLLLVRFRVVVL